MGSRVSWGCWAAWRAPGSSSAWRWGSRRAWGCSFSASERNKEMTMSDHSGDGGAYMDWFLFGAALGAAAALLLAPKTGEETRQLLTQRSGEVAKKAQGLAAEAQGRAGDWLDKSRELFEEQTQRLLNAFEAGKDAMREEIRKGSTPPRA